MQILLVILSAVVLLGGCGGRPTEAQLVRVRVSQFQMGVMVHLTLWASSVDQGQLAAAAAFRRIQEINRLMSDYEPTSELSRLCRQAGEGPVSVSPELFEVLAVARRLAELTDGRYDPTVGPLVRLWREARQTGRPPDFAAINDALRLVGYQRLLLDAEKQTVELTRPGMQLDLGSIAKGFAGDEAVRVLRGLGISRVAFEAGGDKVFGDAPPGETGWSIEEEYLPAKPRRLANCAVSISGDNVQYFEHEGKRFSHVIDPRTGWGSTSHSMCITVAPRGLISDPLATIGSLLPRELYEKILETHFPQVRSTVFPVPADHEHDRPRIPPP